MLYHKHIPVLPLSHYIDSILYIEGNNKGIGFPKTAMSLVFNLNDSFKLYTDNQFTNFTDYKKHWIAGLQTKPSYVESYGQSKMIVVQFKTKGAYAFLHQPLHSFADSYIPLDCIYNNYADETWEQLSEAPTINDKIQITEQFLIRNLLSGKQPKSIDLTPINSLFSNNSNLSIHEICRQHRISRKHLNFLFKQYLGVSPKMMSSLNRLQTVLKTISQSKPGTLTSFAHELDYFDQAHFNNDFKRFTDLRPTDYLKNVGLQPSMKIIPHFLPVA